jgi:hypothetical protein
MDPTTCTEPQYSYTSTPPMGRTACTEPHYSYTSTSPMDRTACTEPQYSYTSTPPMDRTACTEPWCLYKSSLYLLPYIPSRSFYMRMYSKRYDHLCNNGSDNPKVTANIACLLLISNSDIFLLLLEPLDCGKYPIGCL